MQPTRRQLAQQVAVLTDQLERERKERAKERGQRFQSFAQVCAPPPSQKEKPALHSARERDPSERDPSEHAPSERDPSERDPSEHSALQSEHIALKTEHIALQSEHSALQSEHSALKTEHCALQASLAALQATLAALQAVEKTHEEKRVQLVHTHHLHLQRAYTDFALLQRDFETLQAVHTPNGASFCLSQLNRKVDHLERLNRLLMEKEKYAHTK